MSQSNNEQTPELQQQQTAPSSCMTNLQLTFGDDGGQQDLLELKISFISSISSDIKQTYLNLLNQIQHQQNEHQDTFIVFKFEVQTGREREAVQFIQKGLDQDDDNQNTSALQKLFHRPKSTGKVELKEGKGYVNVIYQFYKEKFQTQLADFSKIIDSKLDLNFNLQANLKGTVENSKRSFAAIKPDYFNLKLVSEKIRIKDLINLLVSIGNFYQQDLEHPVFQLLLNLQAINLSLKFNSIRDIMRYYDRILSKNEDDEDENFKERELPLLNKGIFRNSVSINLVISNMFAAQFQAKYKSQQVMLRLIAKFSKTRQDSF